MRLRIQIFGAALGFAACSAGSGAPGAPPLELSVAALEGVEPPRLFYQEPGPEKKPVYREIEVGRGALPPPRRMPPPSGATLLAAKDGVVDPREPADFSEFFDLGAATRGGRWVLLLYADAQGAMQKRFLDASDSRHPAGSVRVVNLGTSRLAVRAGEESAITPPGGEAVLRPKFNEQGRFAFFAAEERAGGGAAPVAPPQMLRFRSPQDRLLAVFAFQPRAEDAPGATGAVRMVPALARLYDRAAEAASQEPPKAEAGLAMAAASEPPVELHAVALAPGAWWNASGPLAIGLAGSRDAVDVEAAPAKPTPVSFRVGARAARELTLRRAGITLASSPWPAGSIQLLLAAVAPVDESGSPALLTFDNSPQSHPPGMRRIFNLTPYQLAYSQGGGAEAVYVNPQEAAIFQEKKPGAPIKLALQTPSGWVLLGQVAGGGGGAADRRALFVYPEGGNGKFAFEEVSL